MKLHILSSLAVLFALQFAAKTAALPIDVAERGKSSRLSFGNLG